MIDLETSSKYADCFDWRADSDWYFFDEDREQFFLTDKAPEEARRSFKRWQKITSDKELRCKLESVWRADSDWYFFDEDREQFFLTDKAPEEARRSFKRWQEIVNAQQN